MLNADVVICQGVSFIEVINGKMQNKQDISKLNMQLNTTKEQAVMILNNDVYKFKFIKKIKHPGGFIMDAYNDGVSEEILYSKKLKIATFKSYSETSEYIATFECKNKKYK